MTSPRYPPYRDPAQSTLTRGLLWALLALLLAGLALAAGGQELPNAPKPHLDRTEWAALAADAGIRSLDVYSTRWALQNGNREMFLPGFIADHDASMAAFSGGVVALHFFAMRELEKHHRPRVAHLIPFVDFACDAPWAIHNLYLPTKGAPGSLPRIPRPLR